MAPDTSPEVDVANAGIVMVEINSARIKKIKMDLESFCFIVYPPSEGCESNDRFGVYLRMIYADKLRIIEALFSDASVIKGFLISI